MTHTFPHSAVRPRSAACATALALVLALTACAVGPNYKRPGVEKPVAYKEAPKDPNMPWKQAQPADDHLRSNWWELFHDPILNGLETRINIANQTVKEAEAQFRQARALVGEARAGFFPTLSGNVSATRSSGGGGRGGSTAAAASTVASTNATSTTVLAGGSGGSVNNFYNASLDVSWEPDLWGRIRRQFESNKATAEASAADLASAQLSAQATLAADYLDLRMADAQKRVLDDSVVAFKRSLELTQNQYNVGVAARSDVMQAKVQLETTEAQALDVGVARAQYEHAIAVLIGKPPASFSIAPISYVPLVPEIPLSVPSELLERRPDIAGAERRVKAANAQIGVTEAAFFPDITLSASGGYESSSLANWFSLPNRIWSIGPSLVETLFDAGLRAAQTEAAIAAYDQTVATYRQTVLNAFEQVEDNLASIRILGQESDVEDQAVKDAKATVTVFLNQYKAGIVSYLNVVTAQTTALNDELTALNVQKARLIAAAALIPNLGGGWDRGSLKKPEVTTPETTPLSILPPAIPKRD